MGVICKGKRFAGWTNPVESLRRLKEAEHPHSQEEELRTPRLSILDHAVVMAKSRPSPKRKP